MAKYVSISESLRSVSYTHLDVYKRQALKLAEDFSVRYDAKGHDPPRRRPVKRKISEELRYRQAEQKCFRVLCDFLHLLERWEKEYAPHTPEETWNPLCVVALQKKPYTEYLLDILLSGGMEERADVYKRQSLCSAWLMWS